MVQKNPYMYGFKQHHLSSISDQSSMLAVLPFAHNISVSYLLFYSYNTYSSYNNTYTSRFSLLVFLFFISYYSDMIIVKTFFTITTHKFNLYVIVPCRKIKNLCSFLHFLFRTSTQFGHKRMV